MVTTNSITSAGNDYHFGGLLNENGVLVGTSDPTAGNQDGSPMFRMRAAKDTPVSVGTPTIETATGDDVAQDQYLFESDTLPEGETTYAIFDLDQAALFQGTNTVTIAAMKAGFLQTIGSVPNDICLIHQSRAKSKDTASAGAARWAGYLYPIVNATPLGADRVERSVRDNRVQINVSMSLAYPWGQTYREAVEGHEGAAIIDMHGNDPFTIHTHKGDAVETDFNLALTPISDTTIAVYVDGLITTDWTRVGKVLTLGSAPADGSYVHTVYQFDTNA
jgi:hypothetical protein